MTKNNLSQDILEVLKEVAKTSTSLHEPFFDGNEKKFLIDCIDSTYVSSNGEYLEKFADALVDFTGAKYVSLVVNGTSALHMALKIGGVNEGDEVLIPSFTFVATANAVSYCNAIPHFIDINESDLGIDVFKLRHYLIENTHIKSGICINKHTDRVIKAIVPMHTFGHPSDLLNIQSICEEFSLVMIEDAAESLGSFYDEKHTGTFGKLGVISFNGNKIITTGGGGAILTNCEDTHSKIRHITTTSKIKHEWEYHHDIIGYNYRMPNLNASLGCAQIEQLPNFLNSKRELFNLYLDKFKEIRGVSLFKEPKKTKSNYWLQTLVLDKNSPDQLEDILRVTNHAGFQTRPAWNLLNYMKPFSKNPSMDLTNSISLRNRVINIPSSAFLR
jgi:aminotransferase in exopolysaccharide biosynthesis